MTLHDGKKLYGTEVETNEASEHFVLRVDVVEAGKMGER